jgi:hypothetical protein
MRNIVDWQREKEGSLGWEECCLCNNKQRSSCLNCHESHLGCHFWWTKLNWAWGESVGRLIIFGHVNKSNRKRASFQSCGIPCWQGCLRKRLGKVWIVSIFLDLMCFFQSKDYFWEGGQVWVLRKARQDFQGFIFLSVEYYKQTPNWLGVAGFGWE